MMAGLVVMIRSAAVARRFFIFELMKVNNDNK